MKNIKWALLSYIIMLVCVAALALSSFASADPVITGTVPLVTYNVQASAVTFTTANISWQTNGDSSSQVFYDTTANSSSDNYASHSAVNSTTALNHSVKLNGLLPGTTYHYRVKSVAVVDGTEFTAVSPDNTFDTMPGLFNGGGGGGGGVAPAANLVLTINMWDKSGLADKWLISNDGILQENASQTSLEGLLSINISKGSKILDADGSPLTNMSIQHIAPPAGAPEGYHILDTFEFRPAGATFDPGIEITVEFNASAVGPDETVVIALYNETTGKWEFVKGVIIGDSTARFTLTHFSIYAVMAGNELKAPDLTPTPTPAPVEDNGGIGTGVIVAIAVGILVVLAAIFLLMRSRKTKKA